MMRTRLLHNGIDGHRSSAQSALICKSQVSAQTTQGQPPPLPPVQAAGGEVSAAELAQRR